MSEVHITDDDITVFAVFAVVVCAPLYLIIGLGAAALMHILGNWSGLNFGPLVFFILALCYFILGEVAVFRKAKKRAQRTIVTQTSSATASISISEASMKIDTDNIHATYKWSMFAKRINFLGRQFLKLQGGQFMFYKTCDLTPEELKLINTHIPNSRFIFFG